MTRYLLAGGGTAGHVNPLLAVADRLRERDPACEVLVLGTEDGLEARLVPARGHRLLTIDRVPFPRRPDRSLIGFPGRLRATVESVRRIIVEHDVEVVVGFGGFVSAPAYLAAWRQKRVLAIHEANAVPGMANRLGSLLTRHVGVAFPGTPLRNARLVGMPLGRELEVLDRAERREEALGFFGLAERQGRAGPVLLVTGGSLGARRINETVSAAAAAILGAGWRIVHVTGERSDLGPSRLAGYRIVRYCDRMDLAYAAADLVIARAGSATVSELSALGIPAVYVPLPIGNGEQRVNARGAVEAGGAVLVGDAAFTPEWVGSELIPLLRDPRAIAELTARAGATGVRDGTERMVALIDEASSAAKGSAP